MCGSPSPTSRTARLLGHLDSRLRDRGHEVTAFAVSALPAEALMAGDGSHPALARVRDLVARADGLVVGTPVYKAAYSGVLKCLLDLLPQHALVGKPVLPLATGGSSAHVLAIDYALRPVLHAMGAAHVAPGRFLLDQVVTVGADGVATIAAEARAQLTAMADQFGELLTAGWPVFPLGAAWADSPAVAPRPC
ncbi:NADPH-dependent FMN reductase [Plantactinospora sp. KBS50]|uniref:NADPH-dependent FMN reductase n=1 Tax=Plantactinospora sp. KBS50 TaxID=2024580 RepID=UPI001E4F87B3|nr:NADPH-dependent FMN reductase [Plantactinospora sp. KBS50]